jgi:hypothetical protein
MTARQLIDSASFGPATLKAIGQAFDAAWQDIRRQLRRGSARQRECADKARQGAVVDRRRGQPGCSNPEACRVAKDGVGLSSQRRSLTERQRRTHRARLCGSDASIPEPLQKLCRPVSSIPCKPLGLEVEAVLDTSQHGLGNVHHVSFKGCRDRRPRPIVVVEHVAHGLELADGRDALPVDDALAPRMPMRACRVNINGKGFNS